MTPLDVPLLADENISPELVVALRERRCEVCTTHVIGLAGASDATVAATRAAFYHSLLRGSERTVQ